MFFVNGTQQGSSQSMTATINDSAAALGVGCQHSNGSPATLFTGYMDEVRISDIARWTSNFTAPVDPYMDFDSDSFTRRPKSAEEFESDTFTLRPKSVSVFNSDSFTLRPATINIFNSDSFTLRPKSVSEFNTDPETLRPVGYGLKKYNVYVYNHSTNALVDTQTVNSPIVTVNVSGLSPSTTYRAYIFPEYWAENRDEASRIVFSLDASGDLIALVPNAPFNLTAVNQAGGTVKLTWQYDSTNQEATPAVFAIYKGTAGSPLAVDYGTAIGTVSYTADGEYTYTTGVLSEIPTIFAVRTRTDAVGSPATYAEETNTDTVTITPDSTNPDEIPFNFNWE